MTSCPCRLSSAASALSRRQLPQYILAAPAVNARIFIRLLLTGFLYPALAFAYPIFDTALVSALRKLTGRPISRGGRDHSSHRLASQGLNQRQVVWILWLLTAFGSSLGIMIHWMPDALFAAGGLLLVLLGTFALSLATLPGYPRPELSRFRRRDVAAGGSRQACA